MMGFKKKKKKERSLRARLFVWFLFLFGIGIGSFLLFADLHGYSRYWAKEGIYLGMEARPKSNQLSEFSKELLLRLNLLDLFGDDPRQAFEDFLDQVREDPSKQKDLGFLFAGAEMANVLGEKKSPVFNRRPLVRPKFKKVLDDRGPISALSQYFAEGKESLHYYDWALHFSLEYLKGAFQTLEDEGFNPRFRQACDIYNYSLEQILRFLLNQRAFSEDFFVRVENSRNVTRVEFSLAQSDWRKEDIQDLLISSDYRPKRSGPTTLWEGLGVPLTAIRYKEDNDDKSPYPDVCAFPLTALFAPSGEFDFSAPTSWDQVGLIGPWRGRIFRSANFEIPLEADLTTPIRYTLDKTGYNAEFRKLTKFIGGDDTKQGSVFLIRPHVEGRIPLVLCHGLLSSPGPWETLVNALMQDTWFREKYEFWFMEYLTGHGFLTNARNLRNSLTELRNRLDPEGLDKSLDQMVLIGQSMGGIICRLLTQESQDFIWNETWKVPIEKMDLSESEREVLEEIYFFEPLPFVKKVFFLGAPHRGSPTASNMIGRLGRKVIRLPKDSANFIKIVYEKNQDHAQIDIHKDNFTSVGQLREDSFIYDALNQMTPADGVAYHNILGNIAKEGEAPHDGVVPLENAKVDWASTTIVVPAAHSDIQKHPLAMQQLRKILKQHSEKIVGKDGTPRG